MATLPTRSQSAIVSIIAAGMQGRVSRFLNFAVGSIFLAIAEAVAGVVLWLQGMALEIAKLTRLQTSYGADVDSWIGQFNFMERIGAVAATGLVTFQRYSASGSAPVIPVGAQVKTADNTQVFEVYADTTNPAYSPTAGGTVQAPIAGYVMPPQIVSLVVPVRSITNGVTGEPGANGNVAAGAISLISSSIPGIDAVSNQAAFTNGSDAETDPAVKARFQLGIISLSRGTPPALQFAIQSLSTNLQAIVLSGQDPGGNLTPGLVTIFVDDGSGALPNTTLAQCAAAAQAYVAAGVRLGVYAASRLLVAVQMNVTVAPGYSRQNVLAVLAATIAANINALGLGNGLAYFTVGFWAMGVPGVAQVDNLLVNGSTADIPAAPSVTLKTLRVLAN